MLHFNKVLERNDFDHMNFRAFFELMYGIRASKPDNPVLPSQYYHRKVWELVMSAYTIATYGKRARNALGIGAGSERTIYYLTRHMDVVATDIYADAGLWHEWCKADMLTHPERYAPDHYQWYPERLTTQHVDARNLPYHDDSFDVVFSASSIEHFGSLADIARAASEIGRVLKRGGVATISTELCLNPHEVSLAQRHFAPTKFFTRDEIIEYIVAPSGLAFIDVLRTKADRAMIDGAPRYDDIADHLHTTPHLALRHGQGAVYTSVHLALQKV